MSRLKEPFPQLTNRGREEKEEEERGKKRNDNNEKNKIPQDNVLNDLHSNITTNRDKEYKSKIGDNFLPFAHDMENTVTLNKEKQKKDREKK